MRFAKAHPQNQEDTRKVKTQTTRQTVEVRTDGEGLVSHAGAFLWVELADRLGLTPALSAVMASTRERRSAHDPGNAGANIAADHFEVLQPALEQLPEQDLEREILARADIGGRTRAFTSDCGEAGIRFSVGYEVGERVREAWRCPIPLGRRRSGATANYAKAPGHRADRAPRPLCLARGHAADRPPRAAPPRRPALGARS